MTGLKRREFKPLPGGGSGTTTSTDAEKCECCCRFVDEGSTVLSDGTITTVARELCAQLDPFEWTVTNGKIVLTFPAPASMQLQRETGTDNLIWNIPSSVFTATRLNGDDATGSLSGQTGVVTFYHRTASSDASCPCEDMAMDVFFDATLS